MAIGLSLRHESLPVSRATEFGVNANYGWSMAIQGGALVSDLGSAEGARLELEPEILAAVSAGRKIDAIKLLREEYGMGLVEAKDIADELMAAKGAAAESQALNPLQAEAGVGRLDNKAMAGEKGAGAASGGAAGGMPPPMQMETGAGRLIGVVLIAALAAASYWMSG